jgi:formate dehydrogenase maturation protein FdhE
MNNRKSKPIPFNLSKPRDSKLLDYAEKQDIAFASYIKNLIEQDMEKHVEQVEENIERKSNIDEAKLKKMIKEVLKELSITKVDLDAKDNKKTKISNSQKASIKGVLKNLK